MSILVVDFGGQYAHLIANRVRRLGFYSEIILPESCQIEEIKKKNAAGIILSGGGGSVYTEDLKADKEILNCGIPVLGICYGFQWMMYVSGGKVAKSNVREYGKTEISCDPSSTLFSEFPNNKLDVWMSHADEVVELAPGFRNTASSENCKNAAAEKSHLLGLQCHIEVTHTNKGQEILMNFLKTCKNASPWSIDKFIEQTTLSIKEQVKDKKVFILVSGGVDSTVAYAFLQKILDDERVYGLLIDTGFMRKNEIPLIDNALREAGLDTFYVERASSIFLERLKDVYDPEQKRKIIGETFLEVKDRVVMELGLNANDWLLGQGTIYPDTIESGGTKHAAKIKTHHNRVDALSKLLLEGKLVEPLKELYKDEVRELGLKLGLPKELVMRHPFPGPGLAIRILCSPETKQISNTEQRQVVLPVKTVGVQGDGRSYKNAMGLFGVDNALELAIEIPNKNPDINRVLLCLSHKIVPETLNVTKMSLTKDRADLLRDADEIVQKEVEELSDKIWQFPVVLLPFGIEKGHQTIVLRPVESHDAMTANTFLLPNGIMKIITDKLLELPGIDMVFYDLTSKPPGTIEWE